VGELYEDPYEFDFADKKSIVTHKPQIVEPLATSGRYDAVISGHTHKVVIEQYPGRADDRETTWVINPGECCGYLTGRKTAALLDFEIDGAKMVNL